MSKFYKKNFTNFNNNSMFGFDVLDDEDFDASDADVVSEKWNPTSASLQNFLLHDFDLARHNVKSVLLGYEYPVSAKEIKGCTLHSMETIERVLLAGCAQNLFKESKGKYSLVN